MVFRNYKKTLAVIGIMAILIPSVFLSSPQKAQAIVPVFDAVVAANTAATAASTAATAASTAATAASTAGLVKKEYILDTIAYAVAGAVLHTITQSIVEWIRSGFQGQPGFITDFQGFLTDAADQATGQFMKEFLSPEVYNLICSPFRANLYLFLKGLGYRERMRCTFSTVMANVQNAADFGKSLTEGGWREWAAISLSTENDPHVKLLTSLDELLGRQSTAQKNAKTESIFNQGFLSMKKCAETACEIRGTNYETGNEYCISEKCIKYETISPGKWVSDTLGQATGIDMQRLALADELNEILAALISQLLTGILQK